MQGLEVDGLGERRMDECLGCQSWKVVEYNSRDENSRNETVEWENSHAVYEGVLHYTVGERS